jgi:competence protein ComEA
VEVFGNQRLPEAAEMVRARLAALFQPAVPAGERAEGPPGEPPEPSEATKAEHLRPDGSERPRRILTSRHLAVIAALTLVAVVASVGWLLRAKAVPIAVAVGPATVSGATPTPRAFSPSADPAPASTQAITPTILVHVIGAVISPGLVKLTEGARVADAIVAAGGMRLDADPAELNLAAILSDGSQVIIGTKSAPRGEVREGSISPGGAAGATVSAVVDLNTATLAQLDTLPGVGPVTAQAILDYRTKHVRFTKIEELQEVDGIGTKTYAQIVPHVRV